MLINLTEEEVNSIMDALIFASCTDACSDWDNADLDEMMTIAEKLNNYTKSFNGGNLYLTESMADNLSYVHRAKRLGVKSGDDEEC